ncbi:GRP family sugar transporter [Pediococcus inopinatus]|uniref:GRP family sugar transporter n=1 Tax=Pediococcus inopinatus TaxID=114090 RepID=A0ABZ0Q4P7_9LACO|nr:GRP family sugar transporter [Pediococcus inopinatus]WPC20219.1 GRP family sugar transporter [Pediococcus inopinatus]WPC21924.1 GRP family sugar transporter [Pediococcus inopinatus]WPP09145.1 GRP family sugar transporter [Pediococcus inopinatus]
MLAIFIGLIPALIWGITPTILFYVKGKATEQLLGTTMGTLIVAILVFMCFRPSISPHVMLFSLLSGIFWSVGQYGQYWAYQRIGISKTFPISTGLQIIGNTLIGGLLLGEWHTGNQLKYGFLGILLIIFGLTVGNLVQRNKMAEKQTAHKKDYLILVLTTIGYWGYSAFPKLASKGSPVEILLFQAIGMVLMACLLVKGLDKSRNVNWLRIRSNTGVGMLFGVAAGTYLVSMSMNGLVNAFLLSQMNMIIATLLGIFWLKEHTAVGNLRTFMGLGLILGGSVVVIMLA